MAALAVLLTESAWQAMLFVVARLSLAVAVLGWAVAYAGIGVNLGILVALLLFSRL
jgi:hypothetical protein